MACSYFNGSSAFQLDSTEGHFPNHSRIKIKRAKMLTHFATFPLSAVAANEMLSFPIELGPNSYL